MTGRIIVFLLILTFTHLPGAIADESVDLIKQANHQYAEGFYDQALELYTKVLEKGLTSAELYYNIGNTNYKLNRIPQAIINYERARRLAPSDDNIAFNLQLAESRITDRIQALPELFYMRWFKSLVTLMPANSWAILAIVILALAFTMLAAFLISKRHLLRRIMFYTAVSAFVIAAAAVTIAYGSHRMFSGQKDVIIIEPSVAIKSAPSISSTDIFLLHEGTKARITDQVGDWAEIRIASGSKGWVRTEVYEII